MDKSMTVTSSFSAGTARHLWLDSLEHGHRYKVAVTVAGLDAHLLDDLELLLAELDLRPLSKMLAGATPDLDGIAGWILEHLVLTHPAITSISVSEDEMLTVTLSRPLRSGPR